MNYLDTSIASEYTDGQFLSELKLKTQEILDKVFTYSPQKRTIKTSSQGLNIACPYCRDSATNSSKKRGHLMTRGKFGGFYKCFNCNKFVSIPKFFTDFEQGLSLSGIKYVTDHQNDISTFTPVTEELAVDIFCKELAMQYGIDRNYFRDILRLLEINHPNAAYGRDYLMKRMQYQFNRFLYEPQGPSIVILNMCEDKVIGFQLRSLNPDTPKDRRFLTFNMSRIYKYILKSYVAPPAELDTVSLLFNIYNIDVYKPVIVVEGPMDAFLLPNAIATTGATKKLNVDLSFWYMFDADDTGNKYAVQKLKDKEKVFMWSKFKTAYRLPDRPKWDVNDVVIYLKEQGTTSINWYDYFSDSILDMWMIDSIGLKM